MITEIPEDELAARAGAMLLEVLRRTHLSAPHDVSTVVAEEARAIGVTALVLYLVDHEQTMLVPVPGPDTGDREPMSVQGTIGGRSYAASSILDRQVDEGRRVWLPLLDGTERMGVMEVTFRGTEDELSAHALAVVERYAHLVTGVIVPRMPTATSSRSCVAGGS